MSDDMGAMTVIIKRGPGRWWHRRCDTIVIYPSDSVTVTNHRNGGRRRPVPQRPRPFGPRDIGVQFGGIANETVEP